MPLVQKFHYFVQFGGNIFPIFLPLGLGLWYVKKYVRALSTGLIKATFYQDANVTSHNVTSICITSFSK